MYLTLNSLLKIPKLFPPFTSKKSIVPDSVPTNKYLESSVISKDLTAELIV